MTIVKRNNFQIVKNISWDDTIDKIENECKQNTLRAFAYNESPAIVCHNDYYPTTIKEAYEEVSNVYSVSHMHMYISFGTGSEPFDRHADGMDVLLVQAIGMMSYELDDGRLYTLKPGDSMKIPKGVYHKPRAKANKRITLSFTLT
jgi:mannose-6-phosphate isomerase-like protein (cupin superfamily)